MKEKGILNNQLIFSMISILVKALNTVANTISI